MTAAEYAERIISQNRAVLFTKSTCPISKLSKEILFHLPFDYYFVDLDLRDDGDEIKQYLCRKTSGCYLPLAFINQCYLGDSEAVIKARQSGELERLLNVITYRNFAV